MINLNDRAALAQIDTKNGLGSIEQLPQQIEQSWIEASKISLPDEYKNIQNVVVAGMGASWLGAHIMQGLFSDSLKVPLLVCHDYILPKYVNEYTLFIASSYSGTTEETISALHEAFERKAKIITISKGGDLDTFAKEKNLPHYTFDGKYNPAVTPRLGLGYSMVAQMVFLQKLGIISLSENEVKTLITKLNTRVKELSPDAKDNEAMQMAMEYKDHMALVASGTFLLGNAHAFSNQFNETAKTFSTFMHIPELNHHLMEGLAHPAELSKMIFLFLESNLYDEKILKRFKVTKEVLEQYKISHVTYAPHGESKLEQSFDVLLFGSFVTYYLAMIYGVDPAPNPYVDYFKKRLKEI